MEFHLRGTIDVLNRRSMALIALVTTFAGVALVIDRPKGTILEWFAFPLLVIGGSIFAWAVWPRTESRIDNRPSIAKRLLHLLTWNGRLVPYFPGFGAAVLLMDLGYNLILSSPTALQTEDIIVILGAATLLSYGLVPERFARERDFVLLFFLWLNVILVAPLLIARAYYANFEASVDVYSWVALAPEAGAVLSLLGVANSVHAVAGSTAPGMTFVPQHLAVQVTVVITTSCSGIYSFGIFASAFLAFVLTEYERMTQRVWMLLGLGLMTSYLANVLRMVVIVLIGYYTDTAQTDLQNMLIAHSYAGWIIFLAWIALFWGIVFRFFETPVRKENEVKPVIPRNRGVLCGICAKSLTPILPGYRCRCGKFYHVACATTVGECPRCHRQMQLPQTTTESGA